MICREELFDWKRYLNYKDESPIDIFKKSGNYNRFDKKNDFETV